MTEICSVLVYELYEAFYGKINNAIWCFGKHTKD
jgi:hypothetical protein